MEISKNFVYDHLILNPSTNELSVTCILYYPSKGEGQKEFFKMPLLDRLRT